jgi:hypothetical protein
VKQGKNKNSYSFQSDAFNGFLQSPQLLSIDKSVSQPSILKRKSHWAYLIGMTSGDTYFSAVLHLAIECQHPSSPCSILTSQQWWQFRRGGQMCAGQYIHIYTDMRMFIAQFLCWGWFQVYIIQTRISRICDIETEGNSVVMCSWMESFSFWHFCNDFWCLLAYFSVPRLVGLLAPGQRTIILRKHQAKVSRLHVFT